MPRRRTSIAVRHGPCGGREWPGDVAATAMVLASVRLHPI